MTTQEAVGVVELYIVGTGGAKEPITGDAALVALRALEAVIERLTKEHNDQVIENSYTLARLESAQFKLDNAHNQIVAIRAEADQLRADLSTAKSVVKGLDVAFRTERMMVQEAEAERDAARALASRLAMGQSDEA